MAGYVSAIAIAVLGTGAVTGLTFGATEASRQVAVMVMPWQTTGFADLAGAGFAVVEVRWRGHVVIMDTGGDADVASRLRARGFWVMDATGLVGCGTDTKGLSG